MMEVNYDFLTTIEFTIENDDTYEHNENFYEREKDFIKEAKKAVEEFIKEKKEIYEELFRFNRATICEFKKYPDGVMSISGVYSYDNIKKEWDK